MNRLSGWSAYPIVCLAALLPAFSQCVLPPAPNQATTDTTFDSFFMQNGPGWTPGLEEK